MATISDRMRSLHAPLTEDDFRPLHPDCRIVQFSQPLSEADYQRLGDLMADRPDVVLRAYGDYGRRFKDLEFLRFFPGARRVQVDLYDLADVAGFRHLSGDLLSFAWGATRSRAFPLRFLERFEGLETLHLEGHAKDIAVVGTLRRLTRLSLRSITLPDLSAFLPLKALDDLELRLGGTRDLSLLPRFNRLRYLELWLIRGLDDLGPVAEAASLQYVFLQALKNVTALPSLSRMTALRRLHLETMKGLTDLSPIAEAPALEELIVVDMRQLAPEAFAPFLGHPTLTGLSAGLGSKRKNEAVKALVPLPPVRPAPQFRFA